MPTNENRSVQDASLKCSQASRATQRRVSKGAAAGGCAAARRQRGAEERSAVPCSAASALAVHSNSPLSIRCDVVCLCVVCVHSGVQLPPFRRTRSAAAAAAAGNSGSSGISAEGREAAAPGTRTTVSTVAWRQVCARTTVQWDVEWRHSGRGQQLLWREEGGEALSGAQRLTVALAWHAVTCGSPARLHTCVLL